MKSVTVIPLACKMKKTPIAIIPALQMKMANQMIGPAQHLTKTKKRRERIIAATAAQTRTSQP